MRLPNLSTDFWELRSAELSAAKYPDLFSIPPLSRRQSIRRGQAVKLIFDIELEDETGHLTIQGERMWVIVSETCGQYYIGILDSSPKSFSPADSIYLCFGAEIPFLAEHVIDIDTPPKEYVQWQLSQDPERVWTR